MRIEKYIEKLEEEYNGSISKQHKNEIIKLKLSNIKCPRFVIYKMLDNNTPTNIGWVKRLDHYFNRCKGKTSLRKNICLYGKVSGKEKWYQYRARQALTNTYEYKRDKYNMSKDQFEEYNKKRSSTLDNFVSRYGKVSGKEKWEKYRKRQAYAGCTEEYFIDKLGIDIGKKTWKEINIKKAHNIDSYMLKYGSYNIAKQKLEDFWNRKTLPTLFYSKKSQELFKSLMLQLPDIYNKIYFAEYNKEFGKFDDKSRKFYFYDFCINDIKLVIEFHGDHYHGNPKIYKPDHFLKGRGCTTKRAKDAWKSDQVKEDCIKRLGYHVIVIWENDYDANKDFVINNILDEIDEIRCKRV